MTAVVFNPANFKILYPEFSQVPDVRLEYFFKRACLIFSNEDPSLIQDIDTREIVLYLLTAHIGKLAGALAVDGQPIPVGRVSSATEGSVTGEFSYQVPGTYQWFIQTQYGAEAWQELTAARAFRYIPGCININFPYPYIF